MIRPLSGFLPCSNFSLLGPFTFNCAKSSPTFLVSAHFLQNSVVVVTPSVYRNRPNKSHAVSTPIKLCQGRGGRPWASVPNKPTVSVDVKQHFIQPNVTRCTTSFPSFDTVMLCDVCFRSKRKSIARPEAKAQAEEVG